MISKALVAASTKPMILSILLERENYGYQIIQKVKTVSGGRLEWSDGMLYPVLHRLEKDGRESDLLCFGNRFESGYVFIATHLKKRFRTMRRSGLPGSSGRAI